MKNFLQKLMEILGLGVNYGILVNQAVKQVEAETAGINLESATKQQIALTYVIAAAHAGEAVPNPTVQTICVLINAAVAALNALGVFQAKKAAA